MELKTLCGNARIGGFNRQNTIRPLSISALCSGGEESMMSLTSPMEVKSRQKRGWSQKQIYLKNQIFIKIIIVEGCRLTFGDVDRKRI